MSLRQPHSINDIRTAIRELSTRADLARKEGRTADAAELDSSDPPSSVATESTEQSTWAELATSDRPAAHYVSAPDGHDSPDVDPRYLSETLMLGNPGERR